jgi:hypothetical protein
LQPLDGDRSDYRLFFVLSQICRKRRHPGLPQAGKPALAMLSGLDTTGFSGAIEPEQRTWQSVSE